MGHSREGIGNEIRLKRLNDRYLFCHVKTLVHAEAQGRTWSTHVADLGPLVWCGSTKRSFTRRNPGPRNYVGRTA
jgi:hypothetical protein